MKVAFMPICIVMGRLVDHGARRSFARVTGSWPGEERPQPE